MDFGAIQSASESIKFNIEIYQAQLSDSGSYNACLTLDGQGSDAVIITSKHDGSELFGKAITDYQEVDTEGIAKFTKNNYSFSIPQGNYTCNSEIYH